MSRRMPGALEDMFDDDDDDDIPPQGAPEGAGRDPVKAQKNEIKDSVTETQTLREREPDPTDQQVCARYSLDFDGGGRIRSLAFLKGGKHVLSGGEEGKIRQWRLKDGKEIEPQMDVGEVVNNIAVSGDGKWIVGGSNWGRVLVWDMETHSLVNELKGHGMNVYAVDISQDGSKIASGSDDMIVCIWSQATGERLLTLEHNYWIAAVKFSPDGSLLATATWTENSVRIYDARDGRRLVEFAIKVGTGSNQGLAWDDNKHLYAITRDGMIHYLDVSIGESLSQWHIWVNQDPGTEKPLQKRGRIALPRNRRFIAASADSSISFWDTTTHMKIGPDIICADEFRTMAISENYDIAIGHANTITGRNLGDILPCHYIHDSSNEAKDHKIDALIAEVDRWKSSDAAKAEKLAAAQKELEERRRDSQELIAIREELQFSQSQTIEARKWYDEQYRYLMSVVEQSQPKLFPVQHFIAQADKRAEMDIINMLQRLNESIHWSSTFIAGRIIHNFQPRTTDPKEEQLSIAQRVADSIGQPLVNRLRSNSPTEVTAYLPTAFRAYFLYHLCGIMSSWSIDSEPNQVIRELYDAVCKLESQTATSRWRSLTYTSISPTCSNNPDVFIANTVDGLSDIVTVAGCAPSTSAAKEMITSKFRSRISFILTLTGQLAKSIMDAGSANYRVEAIRPPKMLDDRTMEVDSAGQGKQSRNQNVLCTTQLGLSKEVITQSTIGPNKKNTMTVTSVIKPKVITG